MQGIDGYFYGNDILWRKQRQRHDFSDHRGWFTHDFVQLSAAALMVPGLPNVGLAQGNRWIFRMVPLRAEDRALLVLFTRSILARYLYDTICSFTGGASGQDPEAALAWGNDGLLYGTTVIGGTSDSGTVFRVTTNGILTTLHSFGGSTEGENPTAALIQASDGSFYGTTTFGGTNDSGTIYRITTAGTFTTIYNFGSSGGNPYSALVQGSDSNFYGTTRGAIAFRISSAGTFTVLHNFTHTRWHPRRRRWFKARMVICTEPRRCRRE